MTRTEHLQWAKGRALAYLDPPKVEAVEADHRGKVVKYASGRQYNQEQWPPAATPQQLSDACASFLSDITKHSEIDPTVATMVYAMEVHSGGLNTREKVSHFINGTN